MPARVVKYHVILSTAGGRARWGTDSYLALEFEGADSSGLTARFRYQFPNYPGDQLEPPSSSALKAHDGFHDQACEYYEIDATQFQRLSGIGNAADFVDPDLFSLRLLHREGHSGDGWRVGSCFLISEQRHDAGRVFRTPVASYQMHKLLDFPNKTRLDLKEAERLNGARGTLLGLLVFLRTDPRRRSYGTDQWATLEFDTRNGNSSQVGRFHVRVADHSSWDQLESKYVWSCEQYFLSVSSIKRVDGNATLADVQPHEVYRMALGIEKKRGEPATDDWRPSEAFIFGVYGSATSPVFEPIAISPRMNKVIDAAPETSGKPRSVHLHLPLFHHG